MCICGRHEGTYLGVLESTTCSNAKYTNTLYITQTFLVILCLACTVIAVILGCIATCCIKYCIPQVSVMFVLSRHTMSGLHCDSCQIAICCIKYCIPQVSIVCITCILLGMLSMACFEVAVMKSLIVSRTLYHSLV